MSHTGSEVKIAMMNRKIGSLDDSKTTLLTMLVSLTLPTASIRI